MKRLILVLSVVAVIHTVLCQGEYVEDDQFPFALIRRASRTLRPLYCRARVSLERLGKMETDTLAGAMDVLWSILPFQTLLKSSEGYISEPNVEIHPIEVKVEDLLADMRKDGLPIRGCMCTFSGSMVTLGWIPSCYAAEGADPDNSLCTEDIREVMHMANSRCIAESLSASDPKMICAY